MKSKWKSSGRLNANSRMPIASRVDLSTETFTLPSIEFLNFDTQFGYYMCLDTVIQLTAVTLIGL